MKYFSQKSLPTAFLSGLLLAISCMVFTTQTHAAEYAVIVNAGNDYAAAEGDMKTVVRRIYLKQQTNWPNGVKAAPFSRGEDAAQTAFNKVVLDMSNAAHSDYWIKKKQTEGTVAPRAIGSTSILSRQIARRDGGVSVVPASDALPDQVRVLFTFSE